MAARFGRRAGVVAIRQIAALPYRFEEGADHATVRFLLVTSRGTGRWVIPKGNVERGLAPHAAAAQEAKEEAGVSGHTLTTSLGSYRYRKRRGGVSQLVEVDVFPLVVTHELARWKEMAQRERRWFTREAAAEAVAETDLRELIRSFSAPEPAVIAMAMRSAGPASAANGSPGRLSRLRARLVRFCDRRRER